jgi:hypothetical protein
MMGGTSGRVPVTRLPAAIGNDTNAAGSRFGPWPQPRAADPAAAPAAWQAECASSRALTAAAASLDVTGRNARGEEFSLRWILIHMIEEYARHNGHADLLREHLDGTTGE